MSCRLPRVALVLPVLVLGTYACSSDPEDCTEFASTEQVIGIQHASGLAPGGDVQQPTEEVPVMLGGLLTEGGDSSASTTVVVYQSGSPSRDEIGWFTSSAIQREADRRGPTVLAIEPYPTTEVTIDGMTAYRSELATDDGAMYTSWVIPGEKHSLDIVLRQGEDALAEENLADDLPELISADGCG